MSLICAQIHADTLVLVVVVVAVLSSGVLLVDSSDVFEFGVRKVQRGVWGPAHLLSEQTRFLI